MNKLKPCCERPCMNETCELHPVNIPDGVYVEKAIYAFCENFICDEMEV